MSMDQHLLESLGWTLVHSLWQAAVIFTSIFLVVKSFGPGTSQYRYVAWIAGLTLVATSSLVTLGMVYSRGLTQEVPTVTGIGFNLTNAAAIQASELLGTANSILTWIDVNLIWVIRIWMIGAVLGLLRMLSGMLYVSFLRGNAQAVKGNWEEKVNSLADVLRITRKVSLAEGGVSTPVVVGYLKPLIVFPVGMLAGLAPAQVEAILIHELAHVRRHDFIVNIFQCVIESLLFFNPFVWIISSRIRLERENCCDDMVIACGVEPVVYVKALAAVEGVYTNSTLAMGLLGQRHQLLHRMKRVMEKSVKRELNGARLLPLSLVVVGLLCASWLSITTDAKHETELANRNHELVAGDTTITGKEARRSKKDNKGDASEESASSYYYYKSFDAVPQPDIAWAPMPPMPAFEFFNGDSIPGFAIPPGNNWSQFEEEFTAKFRDEFGEFFEKNREQLDKIMEELREKHNQHDAFIYRQMDELTAEEMRAVEEQMALINPAIENLQNFSFPKMTEEALAMQEQAMKLSERAIAQSDWATAQSEWAMSQSELAKMQEDAMRAHERVARDMEENSHAYEKEMTEQLIKDGYLGKDEKVNDLHIMNGEVTVNGKKVKKADQDKYKAIIDRFNQRFHAPRRPE